MRRTDGNGRTMQSFAVGPGIFQVSKSRETMRSKQDDIQGGNQKQPFLSSKNNSVGNSNLPKQSKCSSDEGLSEKYSVDVPSQWTPDAGIPDNHGGMST